MSEEELRTKIARSIYQLRTEVKMSRAKLAAIVGVNEKTVMSWEVGRTSPDYPQLIDLYKALGKSPHKALMDLHFPNALSGSCSDVSTEEQAQALSYYVLELAPEKIVHQLYYLCIKQRHGDWEAQVQKMVADAHTPIEGRYLTTQQMRNLFVMNQMRNALLDPNDPMPDIEVIDKALAAAQKAIIAGREHYTID